MKKNNKYNDFERNECLIAKYLSDVFEEQIPDEGIPKPDLSFMCAEDGDAANTAGPSGGVKKKRRFVVMRRVAAAFCALCAIFVVSGGMAVMLSDSEAYAGNPVAMFVDRCISCITFKTSDDSDFSDERYRCKEVFNESGISNIKKMLPEMVLVGSMPDRYEFVSLKLEEQGTGNFTYTYKYKNSADAEDTLYIEGVKRLKGQTMDVYGSSTKIDSVNFELYCQDDVSTGGLTGIYIMSNQILSITGKLDEEDIVDIAKSLSL